MGCLTEEVDIVEKESSMEEEDDMVIEEEVDVLINDEEWYGVKRSVGSACIMVLVPVPLPVPR